jgi:flagellar hook assembly protein FlgD
MPEGYRLRARAPQAAFMAIALSTAAIPIRVVADEAGTPRLEDCRVTAGARQLDVGAGGHATLTSVLPLPARETIVLKDMKGTVVRTLVDETRPAGTYADKWDGKGDGGRRLKDDQYRWVATFGDGGRSFTIDRSKELDGDFELKSHAEYPLWNPFGGVPLRFSHTFERPGEIALVFSRATFNVTPRCDPPAFFCRFLGGYRPAGKFSYEWAGVDDTGAFRPDIHAIFVISHHEDLAKNAIVVYGGRPNITGLMVSPAVYRPDLDPQAVTFHLQAFQRETTSIEISWMSQQARSILRAVSLPAVKPGPVKDSWDGRADSGARVAPGNYLLRVRAVDALGQEAVAEVLTTVVY